MERRDVKAKLDATGRTFALVVSRFNELISRELVEGAIDCLQRHNAKGVDVFWVPGAFEIPGCALPLAKSKRYDGLVGLGAVIRGDTPHAEYIATEVARGLGKVALETGVPVTFGIITADSLEQALERAGAKQGNKGWHAALAVIELVNLYHEL